MGSNRIQKQPRKGGFASQAKVRNKRRTVGLRAKLPNLTVGYSIAEKVVSIVQHGCWVSLAKGRLNTFGELAMVADLLVGRDTIA